MVMSRLAQELILTKDISIKSKLIQFKMTVKFLQITRCRCIHNSYTNYFVLYVCICFSSNFFFWNLLSCIPQECLMRSSCMSVRASVFTFPHNSRTIRRRMMKHGTYVLEVKSNRVQRRVTYMTFDPVKLKIFMMNIKSACKTAQCTCTRTHSCGILVYMCYRLQQFISIALIISSSFYFSSYGGSQVLLLYSCMEIRVLLQFSLSIMYNVRRGGMKMKGTQRSRVDLQHKVEPQR